MECERYIEEKEKEKEKEKGIALDARKSLPFSPTHTVLYYQRTRGPSPRDESSSHDRRAAETCTGEKEAGVKKTEPVPRKNHGGTALKDEQSLTSTDE